MPIEMKNPYIAGAPITDPNVFFGRQDVFDWIRSNLSDHALVIHGQRRVGKTSVLRQLQRNLPANYLSVYYDLQGRTSSSLELFMYGLAREIARAVQSQQGIHVDQPVREVFESDPDYFERDFLHQLVRSLSGQTLVICLDEFDTLEDKPLLDKQGRTLYDLIRRLLHIRKINLIFSIGSSGRKLEYMKSTFTALFKTALYKKITFLSRGETNRLIYEPVQDVVEIPPAVTDYIFSLTSGHPYYIQLICHEIFSQYQKHGQSQIQVTDVESVLDDVVERGTVNLKFIWDEASPLEKWIMVAAANTPRGMRTIDSLRAFFEANGVGVRKEHLNYALLHLQEKEVLKENLDFQIVLFEMWLQKNWPVEKIHEVIVKPDNVNEPSLDTSAPPQAAGTGKLAEITASSKYGEKKGFVWGSVLAGLILMAIFVVPPAVRYFSQATATPTDVIKTVLSPTEIQPPTQTVTTAPTFTPMLTLTPTSVFGALQVISPDNAASIQKRSLLGLGTGWSMDVSPDGQLLAVGGSGGIDIYRMSDYQMIRHFDTDGICWIQLFPDSKKVAGGLWKESTVQIWDVETSKLVQTIKGPASYETVIAISNDSRFLAFSTEAESVKVWDLAANALKWNFKTVGTARVLVFSPDSRTLVSGSTNALVDAWDVVSGEQLFENPGHTNQVQAAAFSIDGKSLATGDWDGNLIFWDSKTGKSRETIKDIGPIWGDAFSPDGKQLAVSVWGSIRVLDLKTKEIKNFPDGAANVVEMMEYTSDGKTLAGAGANHVTLWDAQTGAISYRFPGYANEYTEISFYPYGQAFAAVSPSSFPNSLHVFDGAKPVQVDIDAGYKAMRTFSVSYSKDGKYLASGSNDDTIHLWDAKTLKEVKKFNLYPQDVRKVAFSPNSRWLAAGYEDGTIWLWDPETDKKLSLKEHKDMVTALEYSVDGKRLASGSKDQTIKIWDPQNGVFLGNLGQDLGEVYNIAFSRDGHYLVSASFGDGKGNVILWDVPKMEKIRSLVGNMVNAKAVAFSPDGNLIATGADDGKIYLYETKTGVLIKDWEESKQGVASPITSIEFSPDGRILAVGKGDGLIWEYAVSETR